MKFATAISLARISLTGLLLSIAAPMSAAEKPAPQISVSLRGVASQTIEQGEPWRVVVRLALPRGSKEVLFLAPDAGTWVDTVAVELYPTTGNNVVAQAESVGQPDSSKATLDAKHVAGGLWRFSPEAMKSVAPGDYVLRVRLAIEKGSGWTGAVSAREIPVTVVPAAAEPSSQRIVNRAQDLLLLEKIQEAATTVDVGLKISPRDYSLLKVRAEIAERAGNPLAAILCLNAATFSPGSKKISGQPPPEEIELRDRFEKSRRATVASAPPPSAWTWPPAEVLLALSDEAKKSGFIPAMPERAQGARRELVPPTASATPTAPPPVRSEPMSANPIPKPSAVAVTPPVASTPEPGEILSAAELNDVMIVADASGQWAVGASAGSEYGRTQYSATKATGAPDVPIVGDSPSAWCAGRKSGGNEWIEVSFAQPVKATEVRIRQSNCPGSIVKIEAFEPDGTAHLWWDAPDAYKPSAVREIVWFAVRVPKTSYVVMKVKITQNLDTVPGWKQIDAVQLVGTAP